MEKQEKEMNRVHKQKTALKYMKVCPTSLMLEEMQVKMKIQMASLKMLNYHIS